MPNHLVSLHSQKLTKDVSKVWEHGRNQGGKEDVCASDHCSDQPVLDCPDARVVIHVFCLKMFSDRSNVQLQRTELTHTHTDMYMETDRQAE